MCISVPFWGNSDTFFLFSFLATKKYSYLCITFHSV